MVGWQVVRGKSEPHAFVLCHILAMHVSTVLLLLMPMFLSLPQGGASPMALIPGHE
jgi:hypothetical protein